MTDGGGVAEAGTAVRLLEYGVLGPLEVRVGGAAAALGGRKQRGVLAVLIAACGRPVSVDSLLLATYGEDASPGGKATLHTYVSNLRHVLGDVIVRQGDGYFLEHDGCRVDAAEFEASYLRAAAMHDPEQAASELRAALALWRGHPYADIEANGQLDAEITRLGEMRLAALESRIDAELRAGRHREVTAELDALTVEHPYRENLRALQMLALYRCGRQAEALRAFARTRDLLVEDLGIDPSRELQDLERRILAQDRDLMISVGPTVQRLAVLAADLDDNGWRDPASRERAFSCRDADLEAAAGAHDGTKLAPRGTAGYVVFADPISAVRAARSIVNERTRVAVDVGDLELHDDEPVGPPLARAARLVAIAHPGQALLSSAAHDALAAAAETGWAAGSLGRFDIIGLDPGFHVYQLVGGGFRADFPAPCLDRLPPPVPGGVERSVPGYELRELIGAGQLGEVHRAYQPSVGREVAVRIFGRAMVSHAQFVRRFETASQRITRVEHPHVVPLLDYWRDPNRAVMVNRLITGGHLGQRIPSNGFDSQQMLEIAETIASAVASAHRHGVVHGRIRPVNVLFDAEDNVYLADLGIDEICAGVSTFASTAYDAPERLGGALATPAADIYSLGVLVHEMQCGSPPPPDGPLSPGDGPAAEVIARATDSDPRRRQQSVDELMCELRDAFALPVAPDAMFAPTRNPYRGLEAFEQADADDFHGRDRAVAEMVEVLRRESLLIVIGPSGIGKSSAVKAGLLPALASGAIAGSEAWLVTETIPGRAPFESLAAALGRIASVDQPDVVGSLQWGSRTLSGMVDQLAPDNRGVLVLIDQLEELFTHTVDEDERRAFLGMIAGLATTTESDVRIVATLRADYFDRPLAYPGFDEAIHGRVIALGAMSPDELADAVQLPASAVGVQVQSGVVDRIVAETQSHPGALPLVQHTLAELFRLRTTNAITVADLDQLGGVSGAIGRRAEKIYESLDDRGREAAESVFVRLVNVTEQHDDTRRRVRRTELEQCGAATDDVDTVLSQYGRHRLLTFDRDPSSRTPTVEVAHEALLTEWERFAGWVDEAREDLLARRRIESATQEWLAAGSDPSFLYGGGRLELAEAWTAESRFGLTDPERRFLEASREKVERDRSKRSKRRRAVVAALGTAAVAATAMAAVALVQRRNADDQADVSRARELAGLATLAIDEDPERAILLSLAALDRTDEPSAEALSALHRGTQATKATSVVPGDFRGDLVQSPDGSLFAAARTDGSGFLIIDAVSGSTVADVATDRELTDYGLAFDPTGSTLAAVQVNPSDGDVAVLLYDIAAGDWSGSLAGPAGYYCCSIQFDTTGRWLAALHDDGTALNAVVWDVAAGGSPISFGPAYDVELGVNGTSVVVGDGPRLTVYDIASGEPTRTIDTPSGVEYWDFELDSTGTLAALVSTAEFARRVDVVDITTGELVKTIELRDPSLAQFSADGRTLAVAGGDSVIRLFDTEEFVEQQRLAGTSGTPSFPLFSPDGSRLATAAPGEVRTWSLSRVGPPGLGSFEVSGGPLDRLVVAGDESVAYATVFTHAGVRSAVHRIDLGSGEDSEVVGEVPYYFSTRPMVSPDLSHMTTLDEDFITSVVDLASGESIPLARCDSIRAFDETGQLVAVDAHLVCLERGEEFGAGHSRLVDLRTQETLVDLGEEFVLYAAAFGPSAGGRPPELAAVEERSGEVTVYDLATGEARGTYAPDADWPVSMAVSPDGERLVLLMLSGRLVALDVARLADGDGGSDPTVFDITAHNAGSKGVTMSASGLIATGSSLDGIRVWSANGELVASVPTSQADAPTFAFAAGTDTLYYEDGGGVVRRFPIEANELSELARKLLTRGLTQQECDRFFAGEDCPSFD